MIGLLYEDPATAEEEAAWEELLAQPPPALPEFSSSKDLRSQLHVICALYAHAPTLDQRLAMLDHLESLARQAIHLKACELLQSGWRPADGAAYAPSADAA